MAVERLDIELGTSALDAERQRSTAASAVFKARPRAWLASTLGLVRRHAGGAAAALPNLQAVGASPAESVAIAESAAAAQFESLPVRLSMHDVLTAWRDAERTLGTFDAGSPEWAAVNATRLSLRASYLARFDEYQADDASS